MLYKAEGNFATDAAAMDTDGEDGRIRHPRERNACVTVGASGSTGVPARAKAC
jgi:hypothetical protein